MSIADKAGVQHAAAQALIPAASLPGHLPDGASTQGSAGDDPQISRYRPGDYVTILFLQGRPAMAPDTLGKTYTDGQIIVEQGSVGDWLPHMTWCTSPFVQQNHFENHFANAIMSLYNQ